MGQTREPTGEPTEGGLRARLDAARDRSFVGRSAEVELFRAALAAELPDFAVLHIHGPGGVGKTALLQRFAGDARAQGRRTVLLDGREVEPSPQGFVAALGSALDVPAEHAVARLIEDDRPVVLLDTYERLAPLDTWIRESLIPRLPPSALMVLAGRRPPTTAWRADPAWGDLLRVIALRDLHEDDARTLLESRGVEPARHRELLRVVRGHPLALVLVSDVLGRRDDDASFALEDDPALIERLLGRFLDQVPGATHRQTLYAAAHAGIATERLLRDTVEGAPPRVLFDWLRGLSFTEQVAEGIAVHDLVADVLNAELRWRDPEGFVTLHQAVTAHLERRVAHRSGIAQHRAMLDLLQLYRFHPVTRRYFDWERSQQLWLERATPQDHDAIVAMAHEHEGEASAGLVAYWLDRQPDSFAVFRAAGVDDPRGFIGHLLLGDAPGEEVHHDPAMTAVWDHVRATGPLRPGERLRVLRFWVARDTYQSIATHHLVSTRSSLDWLATERLAWGFVVLADPDFYEQIFAFIDFERPPGLEVAVGDRRFGMFARDFRTTSRRAWLQLLRDRRLGTEEHVAPDSQDRLLVLAQEDFEDAVRDALRGVARPGGLDGNPLLRSRVVAARAHGRPPSEVLVELLERATDELAVHPRDEKLRRALELTYFRPAPSQEAAAERLELPFSTFRRHLTAGVEHVTSWLWERELHGEPADG